MNQQYAVIDIETTGLKAGQEKITEIAILLHDGIQVTDSFSSLVHPERKIPYFITQLTGINDQMVASAPKFYELARQIVEMTENTIIVGHNVNFDYSFLKAEFKSLGYDFQRKTLDTVRLSRKLIPGQPSYSLGKLCKALNIKHEGKHRALGDASATAKLFALLFSIDGKPEELSLKGLNSSLSKSLIENLPEKHGVYYFYDKDGKLIYVGKSNNIKARVLQHLNNSSSRKAIEMKNNIADVSFQLTGNELIALLLESDEIKKHKPLYNRQQRRSIFNYGLYHFTDEKGYLCLKYAKTIDNLSPHYAYTSQAEAREHLTKLTEQFQLCQRLNGLYPGNGACFHVHIGQCFGACCEKESPQSYNLRAEEALERYHFEYETFYIIEDGCEERQHAVVKIENGVYFGFGFVDAEALNEDPSMLNDCITRFPDNRDVRQIIRSYLKKHHPRKIIVVN